MNNLKSTAFLLCVFWLGNIFGQNDTNRVKCLFVGDIMQHGGQIEGAYNKKQDTYDYRDCFQFVKPLVKQADIAIANLEVTHAGKPYKGYPQFSAPPQLSEALVDAGFNVIITANNHSCDGGSKGVVKTLDVLDQLGVQHTGTFRNKAERDKNYPLMMYKNGLRIAILNYTYGTNGLSVAAPLIINYIDSAMMLADFKKARDLKPDAIICTMHWGTEYQSLPNSYQKKWEKFCYDQGADMVIGGHPHVLQPVELKEVNGKQRLTAWSLGNFVSNQRDRYKDGGMILRADLVKSSEAVNIEHVTHTFTWVYPRQEAAVKPFYILPEFDYGIHRPDFFTPEVQSKSNLFYTDSRALFQSHSKGSVEYKVDADSTIVTHYKLLLSGYYAQEYSEGILRNPINFSKKFTPTIHKVVAPDGTYHWVIGYFLTEEEARGTQVHDAVIPYPRMVFISPTIYKVLP